SRVKTPFKPVGTGPTDPRHKQSLKLRLDIWAPHQPSADYSGAPSVSLPENVIPSADASMRLFPESYGAIARFMGLRVSGAVAPSAPARGRSLPQQYNLKGRRLLYMRGRFFSRPRMSCHWPLAR